MVSEWLQWAVCKHAACRRARLDEPVIGGRPISSPLGGGLSLDARTPHGARRSSPFLSLSLDARTHVQLIGSGLRTSWSKNILHKEETLWATECSGALAFSFMS